MSKKTGLLCIAAAIILIFAGAAAQKLSGRRGEENMDQNVITAMYIPLGEEGHIFVGEQAGVFTVVFPEEIYDINGKKITQRQLVRGNMVRIYGNGIMLESYPGQYPGVTRIEVAEEGSPSDADVYQDLVDEIYTEPDPAEPPALNLEYNTDLASVTAVANLGGYEWTYVDKDGLSSAVIGDSTHVLQWKVGEELTDVRLTEPVNITLSFSKKPKEVEVVRYDASFLNTEEFPEGETISVGEKDGEFVIADVEGGFVYEVTGIWENGRADYGFIALPVDN